MQVVDLKAYFHQNQLRSNASLSRATDVDVMVTLQTSVQDSGGAVPKCKRTLLERIKSSLVVLVCVFLSQGIDNFVKTLRFMVKIHLQLLVMLAEGSVQYVYVPEPIAALEAVHSKSAASLRLAVAVDLVPVPKCPYPSHLCGI
jgi:hypothetical protein